MSTLRSIRRWLARGPGDRALLIAAVCGAVVLTLVIGWPLLTGRVPVYWDLGVFHLPLRDFYADCLARGEPFDWIPQMHCGMFLTGEGEHGPYHPVHWLLYRWLPLDVAFALEACLHFPLALLGMMMFLRRHTPGAPAVFGGLVFAFSTNFVAHGLHPNLLAVLAHLPWLLWLIDVAVGGGGRGRAWAVAGIGLLTGSQLLLGHPQAMSYSLLAEMVYGGFLVGSARPRLVVAAQLAAGKLLGLLVGAVQLWATYDLLTRNSSRGEVDPFFGSYDPTRMVQILAPNLLSGHIPAWNFEPLYVGAVPVVLAVWWLNCSPLAPRVDVSTRGASGLQLSETALGLFAVVLGVLSVWLASGWHGGLYRWQTLLPLVGKFRAPARYVCLTEFALAVLAAVALARLIRWGRSERTMPWRRLWLPWSVALASATVAVLFARWYPQAETGTPQQSFLVGPLLFAAAATALTLAARGYRVGLLALVIVGAADLGLYSLGNPVWGKVLWRDCPTLEQYLSHAARPPVPRSGRILAYDWAHNQLMFFGERLVNGYRGGIEPRRRLNYETRAALRVCGAHWFYNCPLLGVPDLTIAGLQPVPETGWWIVPDPLPRARLVTRAVVSDAPAADLLKIDIETTALVAHPVELSAGASGMAVLTHDLPGEIRLDVTAAGRQLLVTNEGYDPNWTAAVDGRAVAVERVNGDFLGCVVGDGAREVVLRFQPVSVRYGRMLSLAGVFAALLTGLVPTLRRRPAVAVKDADVRRETRTAA